MTFEFLHLSDLHFGNPDAHLSQRDVNNALDTLLNSMNAPSRFLIISGDITFQGNSNGYKEAAAVINEAIEHHKLDRSKVLVCPGNHDIVQEKEGRPYFTSFDEWSTRVRGDKECTFAGASARLIENDTGDFLLLNTAHHADHKMGLIDLKMVENLLKKLPTQDDSSRRLRVAIAHHHLIPVLPTDTSTTRNAYPFIQLLETYGFTALLHGHQHAMLSLSVGSSKIQLSGVGSLSYSTPGYINSVAIYRGKGALINKEERFGLTLDASSGIVKILSTN